MSYIIDRRLNSRNKNAVNRQRFMRRYKSHIQKAVQEAIKQRTPAGILRSSMSSNRLYPSCSKTKLFGRLRMLAITSPWRSAATRSGCNPVCTKRTSFRLIP